jgi:hypothetical protein
MGFLISSHSGHLCVDGKRVLKPLTDGLFPSDQFCDGDLSIPSTDRNILTVSQCFLDLYINPMGMLQEKRSKGKKWLHSTSEIEIKFGEIKSSNRTRESTEIAYPNIRQSNKRLALIYHTHPTSLLLERF